MLLLLNPYDRHKFLYLDVIGELFTFLISIGYTVQTKIIDLDAIAESSDFDETIRTADLVGKTFTINNVKTVNGLHGESYVGDITIDGENREAWLSGKKLSQALDQITEADALPYGPVTITQGEEAYSPFVLRDA